MSDVIVKVGGEGGTDSPTTAGEFIAQSAIREGIAIFTLRTFPAEIKGGLATYQIRLSDQPVISQGDRPDVLFCMNQEAYDSLFDELRPDGGVLVYDSDSVHLDKIKNDKRIYYGVPMQSIAEEQLGERRTKNMVLLGVLSQLFGLGRETLKGCVSDKYGKRGEQLVALNHSAIDTGATYAAEHLKKIDPFVIEGDTASVDQPKLIVDGSQAVGMGAAAAGLQVYCGYPITPASDIMHWLASELPKFNGTVIQVEDEIAALGACLGASFAGAKTMTATSGPGLSLMVEELGLASMAELPVVLVDVQRGGPSTGLPTKCENGDLNLAVYGAHGDAPRVVLAPANIEDCFWDTITAFNLAEKYQTPVILLSDQSMAMRAEAMPIPDLSTVRLVARKSLAAGEQPGDFRRYKLAPDGVSTVALPGHGHNAYHTITGLSHDEHGNPSTNNGPLSAAFMEKRYHKLEATRREPGLHRVYGPERAPLGVISWGSNEGAVREAVIRLAAEGLEVRQLHLRLVAPLPVEVITEFAATVDKLVVCELNFSGQLSGMIRAETMLRTTLINKYDGVPFKPGEVAEALRAHMPAEAKALAEVATAAPARAKESK
jgi:2-oxoglutarate ferredoxin oxidoreductase subunit alpha